MKSWLTFYQQVVRVFGDGFKGSMEENVTVHRVGCGVIHEGVGWGCGGNSIGVHYTSLQLRR